MAEAGQQVRAGLEGAADAGTLGASDLYVALKLTQFGLGVGDTPWERFKWIREQQTLADAYDAETYSTARTLGQLGGEVTSIFLTGGLGTAGQTARLAPLAAKPLGAATRRFVQRYGPPAGVAASGAAVSATGETAAALATGSPSEASELAAAGLGGAAGGLVTLYAGPRAGGAADAVVSSGAASALGGEPFSLEDLQRAAVSGAHLGRLGDVAGTQWADKLPNLKKGKLGEQMSEIKTRLQGEKITGVQVRTKVPGGHSVTDSTTDTGRLLESKFGRRANLTGRQRQAQALYSDVFDVDAWLPADIGKVTGGFLALIGGQGVAGED